MSRPPEIGGFGGTEKRGNYLPDRYLRSSGQGGKAGRTPCLPSAALIGSLSLSVTVSQPEWFVAKRIRLLAPLTVPMSASSAVQTGLCLDFSRG